MRELFWLEVKKVLFRKSTFIITCAFSFLAFIMVGEYSVVDTWGDMFSKFYFLSPFLGIAVFALSSNAYTGEYVSEMDGMIKTTERGDGIFHKTKCRAVSVSSAVVCSLIVWSMFLSAGIKTGFRGLNLSAGDIWYFKGTSWDLKVWQVLVMISLTVVIGAALFSLMGVLISSFSQSSSLPFILGGLIMGAPFFMGIVLGKSAAITPLWGMMSTQLIRMDVSRWVLIYHILTFLGMRMLVPILARKNFIRER